MELMGGVEKRAIRGMEREDAREEKDEKDV